MDFVFTMALWSAIGFTIWLILCWVFKVPGLAYSSGIEFVNPKYLYEEICVNWFGAIFLATIYGSMCPIGTIIYWIYKLCTVGRKDNV